MIYCEDLYKSFGSKKVLQGINLHIPKGESTVIIGGSGSGKSVLIKHIIGLLKPDSGRVVVDGQVVGDLDEDDLNEFRKKFGMLFQGGALFDSLTVGENVGFALKEHTTLTDAQVGSRVGECLEMVGLGNGGVERLMPSELSGGMKKRVGLARAIAMNPQIILFDEPTTGLDPITSVTIDAEIIKLRDLENVSTIMVTHQLRDAFYVAEHTAVREDGEVRLIQADPAKVAETEFIMLRDGDIAFEGDVHELRGSRDPYLQSFLS